MKDQITPSPFTTRPVHPDDLPVICGFPQNQMELFYLYPKATFPLTVDQLQSSIEQRVESTVLIVDSKVAGFANFYRWEPGIVCTIGNVVVSPAVRGKGAGQFLIRAMIKIAKEKYHVSAVQLSCFNINTYALFFYSRLGFKPYGFEERIDPYGNPIISIHMTMNV